MLLNKLAAGVALTTLATLAATGQPQTVTQPTQPGENAVAITAEPAGGSAAPTFPIVWMTELTS